MAVSLSLRYCLHTLGGATIASHVPGTRLWKGRVAPSITSKDAEPMISRRSLASLALSATALTVLPRLGTASVAHAADGEERLVTTYTVKKGDTLHSIAQKKGLGFLEMRAANPDVEPWLPEVGRDIIVPSVHIAPKSMKSGVLLSLGAMRLFHFRKDGTVNSYPIGIGADGLETPTGRTKIVRKKKNPNWYPTENIRKRKPHLPAMVPAGPDNPLGTRAMYLGWPAYLIHGTNLPEGVGRASVLGMYPHVPVGRGVDLRGRRGGAAC